MKVICASRSTGHFRHRRAAVAVALLWSMMLAWQPVTLAECEPQACSDSAPGEDSAVPGVEWRLDTNAADTWTAQPDWLDNETLRHTVTATPQGLRFSVPEGLQGMKWSHLLREALSGTRYAVMRYRARNLRGWGEYVLYAASTGPAPAEAYVIGHGELTDDGQWHVHVSPVSLANVGIIAIQVQAAQNDAFLEVAELRLTDRKPVVRLADTFEATPGWPTQMDNWRPVALPPGNLPGEKIADLLHVEGWIGAGHFTVGGVPVQVGDGKDAAIATAKDEPATVVVPLAGQASEAYLLVAADFPRTDEPSYGGSGGVVRHVHRFVARIEYTDGSAEEQFPLAVNARRHAISRGLHMYALALAPGRALRQLSLFDRMPGAVFALAALTLSQAPGPASEATAFRPAPQLPALRPPVPQSVGIARNRDLLEVHTQTVAMTLNLSRGLRVERVTNLSGEGLVASLTPGPLFRLLGKDWQVDSEQFVIERVAADGSERGDAWQIDLRCDSIKPPARVNVRVDVEDPREIGLVARIDLNGHDPQDTRFIFPELNGIGFGGPTDECWIWSPRRGDVITATPVSLREPYAGAGNPLQIIGAFDPVRGTGLYLMTQDLDGRSKFYHVEKSAAGARLAVEYNPLHDEQLPRAVIGCQQGDWHQQLARYQEWVAGWYHPAAPRKPWFRQVWNFRQQFLHFELPSKSGMFDAASKTIRLQEILAVDAVAFGGVDYLHLFDWGWDPVHGRCGDYDPWEYLGGAEAFRQAIDGVQSAGVPVGLYIEGILVDSQSNLGRAHGAAWQMLGPGGKPYAYFAPSFHICSRVIPWQEYLSRTYRRVRQQTGATGYYIDEFGFSGTSYWCYRTDHGHPVPVTPVLGERELTRKVREQLGPEAVIYTEESPTDVNSQYQDGSFTYSIASATEELSTTGLNLYRFTFPSFKTIEIICCDKPLGTNVEAVKRCLFNGEAIWIEGIWDKWFSPEVRAQIALNRRLMRDNADCFASDEVRPLVPTLVSGIYANQFAARADLSGKTCWTIYNTTFRTVSGEVIAVDHRAAAKYIDEMGARPLEPRVADEKAHLRLEIGPREVIVVSREQ